MKLSPLVVDEVAEMFVEDRMQRVECRAEVVELGDCTRSMLVTSTSLLRAESKRRVSNRRDVPTRAEPS